MMINLVYHREPDEHMHTHSSSAAIKRELETPESEICCWFEGSGETPELQRFYFKQSVYHLVAASESQ